VEGGGWRVEGGGWRVEGGGRRVGAVSSQRTRGVIMAAGPQPQFWKTHRPKNIMPSVAPPG
jgi:hypothetical protein